MFNLSFPVGATTLLSQKTRNAIGLDALANAGEPFWLSSSLYQPQMQLPCKHGMPYHDA